MCFCNKGKVHFQHIGFDDRQLGMRAQALRQVPVQFDHREPAEPLQQRLRQGRQAGADLHHGLARLGCNFAHDGVDDGRVGQEVLAEALARDMRHGY